MVREAWTEVIRKGKQKVGETNGWNNKGNEIRWYFMGEKKQFSVDLLKSGAIRVTEFSAKQSYIVLIDSRAVQWMVGVINGIVKGAEKLSSPKFWHEGLVTISLQILHNNRGAVLKILKLSGSGRQMVLIPEGDNKRAWCKFLDALQDKQEGPNFKGISSGPQASTSANGGFVCEPHQGTTAAEGGHPIRLLQRGNNVKTCDWEPALVIFRSSRYAAWEEIEERLTLALNRPTSLKSIGEDRAILFCSSEAERMRIIHQLDLIEVTLWPRRRRGNQSYIGRIASGEG
ncbi:hypothetical protein Syun_013900 [Stephania yunnanensis]|uniref:Uncharacterized protein n=1 Tax=Stephania yunnanensis TaxID=152371 RepID=A0AAP0JJ29_9MAGN